MPSIIEQINDDRYHTALKPTELETQKINLLKEAAKLLLNSGLRVTKNNGKTFAYDLDDILKPLYLFDNTAEKNSEGTLGEAIVERGEFKGSWMDRNYLDNALFGEALGTYLHELCHQHGGDESEAFSYAVTDVMKEALQAVTENPFTAKRYNDLCAVWKQVNEKQKKAAA